MASPPASDATFPEKQDALLDSSGSGSSTPIPKDSAVDVVPEEPPRTVTGLRWVIVCFSLYLGALIYGLDTTIAADIQGAVIDQFGAVEKLTWIGTAFPLGSVCAVLPTYVLSTIVSRIDH